ncbi:MAG: ATP synthase F1 subunit gamma [Rickettsiales bacterium]|nr:ATP synthase F1 subunit gamma [Rickettsiales bacterium]
MSSLKNLRIRMNSIKSTKKMTQAMKLVSASKLRKAKDVLDGGRPYFNAMDNATIAMLKNISDRSQSPISFGRSDVDQKILLIAFGSHKGLCGSFNINLVKKIKTRIAEYKGVAVEIICIGKKVYELLKPLENQCVISLIELHSKEELEIFVSNLITDFDQNRFDSCYFYYNRFVSAMSQEVSQYRLIPLFRDEDIKNKGQQDFNLTECFPESSRLVKEMVPKILLAKLLSVYQESQASEHGSRMTSMDNATKNAGEMLKKLNTIYNRTRQAAVTTELIEILAGAEAVKSN